MSKDKDQGKDENLMLDLTPLIGQNLPPGKSKIAAPPKTAGVAFVPQNLNAWGMSGQIIVMPEGIISVDDFVKREREMKEWLRIKNIIEKHSIIEDLPDGDVVIRIKRKRMNEAHAKGEVISPSEFIVDFGVDEQEEE